MNTSNRKIFVIEDDKPTQELIFAYFRQKGFEVRVFDDAESVLKEMAGSAPECEVILTDLRLPHLSGIDFIKKFKEAGFDCPIILMTAQKGVEVAVEAIDAGAYDFVVKPLHFPQLLVSVERALHFSKMAKENSSLKTAVQIKEGSAIDNVIGKSPAFRAALDLAKRVAHSTTNILILGESGTGKEVLSRSIHSMSPRAKGPFVAINCSAIPENLLESELFGHTKGAFTGAADKKIGLFEEAEGGTLFLDEIGDMSLPLQAKLLRVLQERKIRRIGENQMRDIDVRIVSATHKNLKVEVEQKTFREDLFYRLNVVQIRIPPLRERKEDIVALAEFFLHKFAALNGSKAQAFSKTALEKLMSYSWPGNVRELENAVERAVVLCNTDRVEADDLIDLDHGLDGVIDTPYPMGASAYPLHLTDSASASHERIPTLNEIVQLHIKKVLEINGGAREKTAKDLDIDRKTLYRKLQDMGI